MPNGGEDLINPGEGRDRDRGRRDGRDWTPEFRVLERRINIAIFGAFFAAVVALLAAFMDGGDGDSDNVEVTQNANPVINIGKLEEPPELQIWPEVQCEHFDPMTELTYSKSARLLIEDIIKAVEEKKAEAGLSAELTKTLDEILEYCQWYLTYPQAGSTDTLLHSLWCAKLWDGYLKIMEPDGTLLAAPNWAGCGNELEPPN